MRKSEPPSADSYLDGIISTPAHSKQPTLKTDFNPWHKPRKQWVRKYQWLQEVEKLSQKIHFESNRPLRYLSLPGTDMLDVRCLHSWCKGKKIHLKFLGYNDPSDSADPNDTELHISQAELTQREFINGDSIVILDKFEKISDEKSIAYERMVDAGPLDVINLDLCNSIAGHVPLKNQPDYYNAISNIVQFQKEHRTEPWLLFITTRVNRQLVNRQAEEKLFRHIKNNAKLNDGFNRKLANHLGINSKSISANNERIYRHLIGLGLGKWLLGLLIDGQPKWRIKMLKGAEYKVNPSSNTPDMLSLSFECSLIVQPPQDKVGLTRGHSTIKHETVGEFEYAINLLDALLRIEDIDKILRGNGPLRSSLIDEAAYLMKDARYDDTAFRKWARKF